MVRSWIRAAMAVALAIVAPPGAGSAFAEGRSFAGQMLAGRDFTRQVLPGADFSGANLRGANFRQAKLKGASFRGADLRGVSFVEADLTEADLTGSQPGFSAERANLAGANLEGLDLSDARFDRTNLLGANLRGTRGLQNPGGGPSTAGSAVPFDPRRRLTPPSRDGEAAPGVGPAHRAPHLDGAQAMRPDGPGAAIRGGDFRGQRFARKNLQNHDFRGAVLDEADFELADLTNATFVGASLAGTRFRGANLSRADFTGADLRAVDLERARMPDAKLNRANLEGQTLHLAGSSAMLPPEALTRDLPFGIQASMLRDRDNGALALRGAILRFARLFGTLAGVDLRGADLRGADLNGAENLDRAILNGAIYDSRTRWNVDPAAARAVRGEEAPIGVGFYRGSWVIETRRPVGPPAPDLGLLDIFHDGRFEWTVAGDPAPLTGRWTERTGPDGAVIVLTDGEDRLAWTMAFQGDPVEDRVELLAGSGGPNRRWARRSARP